MTVFFLSLWATFFAFADSKNGSSGITGPSYNHLLLQMAQWSSHSPQLVQIEDYGRSVLGKTLRAVVVAKEVPQHLVRFAILVTGSIHGNEYLNIEDRLPLELIERAEKPGPVLDYLSQGHVLVFVPIVNPDGYERKRRTNANGADLNRDWDIEPAHHIGFRQPESKSLAQWVDDLLQRNGLKLEVVVDYHCCAGALLHPWAYTKEHLPTEALHEHLALASLMTSLLKIRVGTTGEILGYRPLGTTKDYYHSKYGTKAFTYEGVYGHENKYLAQHVQWWERILNKIIHRNYESLIVLG